MSHVEFFHELPGYTEFLNGLASFTRVIVFDKRGNGLSDRLTSAASLEERMDDIAAIMDAVGSERAVPFGVFSQNRVASYRHKSRHRESDFSKCVTNRGVPAAPVAAPRMGFDWDRFPVVSVEHHRGRATLKRVGLTGWQNSHKQWTRKGADQEATVPSFCMTRRGILIAASMALMVARVIGTAAPVYASGVVTHCDDDSEFSSKLAGGGTVTFNCGSATIVLGSTQTITGSATIDGGGTIALSGENARRLFIVNPGARLELHNIVIENGQSDGGDGGAIYNQDTVVITNSVFRNNATNSAWTGGAIFSTSHLAVSMSVFSNNTAGSGGALSVLSNVSQTNIYGSTFDQNHTTNTTSLISGIGGALFLADHATATITASTLSNNQARRGGAVYAQSGSLLIIDTSHITGNSTSVGNEQGGGIYDELSTAMLTDVDLSGNMAGEGGGLYTFGGEVTLNKVTLSSNLAAYGAGFHAFLGMHTLTNVTISGNTSDSGGALYNSRSTMTLTNVTIANNSTNTGQPGGIVNSGGGPDPHLNLKNVLIAKGAVGTNCEFVFLPDSSDANLSDDASCNFGPGRDNAALNLGPLADNGGFTNTHLPGPGSIAIGNGTNIGCPSTDQRGVSRPQGLFCEVGAVETGPAPPTFSRTPTASITSTPSRTTTPTHTPRPVATPTPTTTSTPSVTKTSMPTPTATASQKPTGTPSDTPTRTFTESPTATFSASPSVTYTPTHAATATPTPSGTASQTPTLTRTATPSATFIPTGAPSLSPSHTRTQTIAATPTNTASQTAPLPPTETATVSFSPTATATPSITDTPTNVSTATPSLPATPTYTATAAPTATATVTPKPSPTSTFTSVCVGDCGGTHTVAVNDVIVLVNITLGTAQPTSCPSGVPAGATVDVSLIIQAVNNALNGCPGD